MTSSTIRSIATHSLAVIYECARETPDLITTHHCLNFGLDERFGLLWTNISPSVQDPPYMGIYAKLRGVVHPRHSDAGYVPTNTRQLLQHLAIGGYQSCMLFYENSVGIQNVKHLLAGVPDIPRLHPIFPSVLSLFVGPKGV
jgi:hypothetical protein